MIYEPRPRPLSEALAVMPDLRNRLLADHVPDASGHRCRACTTPGTGTPGAHWPCRIREAADAAPCRTGHSLTGNEALAHDSSCPPRAHPNRGQHCPTTRPARRSHRSSRYYRLDRISRLPAVLTDAMIRLVSGSRTPPWCLTSGFKLPTRTR
jgi:hypothetical protein